MNFKLYLENKQSKINIKNIDKAKLLAAMLYYIDNFSTTERSIGGKIWDVKLDIAIELSSLFPNKYVDHVDDEVLNKHRVKYDLVYDLAKNTCENLNNRRRIENNLIKQNLTTGIATQIETIFPEFYFDTE